MPDPTPPLLSPESLAAIAARVEAASPPPWTWREHQREGDEDSMPCLDDGNGLTIMHFGDSTTYYPSEGEPPGGPDERFIAAARTDLPALLAHVAAQAAENERLTREKRELELRLIQLINVLGYESFGSALVAARDVALVESRAKAQADLLEALEGAGTRLRDQALGCAVEAGFDWPDSEPMQAVAAWDALTTTPQEARS